jgi:hypothetical protein
MRQATSTPMGRPAVASASRTMSVTFGGRSEVGRLGVPGRDVGDGVVGYT